MVIIPKWKAQYIAKVNIEEEPVDKPTYVPEQKPAVPPTPMFDLDSARDQEQPAESSRDAQEEPQEGAAEQPAPVPEEAVQDAEPIQSEDTQREPEATARTDENPGKFLLFLAPRTLNVRF